MELIAKRVRKYKRERCPNSPIWLRELSSAKIWILKNHPVKFDCGLKITDTFFTKGYKGLVLWTGIGKKDAAPLAGVSLFFLMHPKYWDFDNPRGFFPYRMVKGIGIPPILASSFLEGLDKLEQIFKRGHEMQWSDVVVHRIGYGKKIGPYPKFEIRFLVDKTKAYFNYKIHIWYTRQQTNGAFLTIPTRAIAVFRREHFKRMVFVLRRNIRVVIKAADHWQELRDQQIRTKAKIRYDAIVEVDNDFLEAILNE